VSLKNILFTYSKEIEKKIIHTIQDLGPKSVLRDACEYALKNGGRRFRPALVLLIADSLPHQKDASDAALAVEYFHTASLIADDLPCMDDGWERRNHPTLHRIFGESTALLTTYALIAVGYDLIRKNAKNFAMLSLALEYATLNTGIFGATGGQYDDLHPQTLNETALRKVIAMKPGALFEISFIFGWLFGEGDPQLLPEVKKAAYHFGMAFQIIDDFEDLDKDLKEGRQMNYPALVGKENAFLVLEEEIQGLKLALEKLQLKSPELFSLISCLENGLYSQISAGGSASSKRSSF
jgi:geranylgeranyl diphosphate synthase type II